MCRCSTARTRRGEVAEKRHGGVEGCRETHSGIREEMAMAERAMVTAKEAVANDLK